MNEQPLEERIPHPEYIKLYKIPSIPCSGSNLRAHNISPIQIFTDPAITLEWAKVSNTLELLNIPDQTAGVNPGDRRALFFITYFFKPAVVLEIGTHIGASTHIAAAMHLYCGRELISVDVVDVNDETKKPWIKYGTSASPKKMIESLGYKSQVQFCKSDGAEFLKTTTKTYDLIFIDGDHHASITYVELAFALSKLKSGGVIVLHDYYPDMKPLWSQTAPIVGPFLSSQRLIEEGCPFEVMPLGTLPWATKLNTNLTSLAIVSKRISKQDKPQINVMRLIQNIEKLPPKWHSCGTVSSSVLL